MIVCKYYSEKDKAGKSKKECICFETIMKLITLVLEKLTGQAI